MKHLLAVLLLSTSTAAAQQPQLAQLPQQFPHWSVSFQPGVTDAAGHYLGGTEIRDLVAFGGKLYASNSYWMDQSATKHTAQVLVLDSPDAQWRQDVDFGDFCPPSTPACALATGALANLAFKKDRSGDVVNVAVLVASIWPVGPKPQPIKVYARNNSDGGWHETVIADADNGQARSFGAHQDSVTKESLAFVAGGSIGVYHGWLADKRGAGKNIIEWVTGEGNAEYNFVGEDHCTGTGRRIMAFAEAEGSLYATECFDVLKRRDGAQGNCKPDEVSLPTGCEQRWFKVWTLPNPPSSESGFRGMTTVTAFGQQWLLLGFEGASAVIIRFDPLTDTAQTELDVSTTLNNAWGEDTGYVITSYSAPMPLIYGADGIGRRIIGFEVGVKGAAPAAGHSFAKIDRGADPPQQWGGDGWYFLRDAAWAYRLFRIPRITAGPMIAVRAAAASPWASECDAQGRNCAVYFGGFDCNKAVSVEPCYAGPCNLPAVPTTNTGWIVKGSP